MQPYLALALGLMAQGHEVQIAAPEQFASFASSQGVPFAPLSGEFLALLDTTEGKAAIATSEIRSFRPDPKLSSNLGAPMTKRLVHMAENPLAELHLTLMGSNVR